MRNKILNIIGIIAMAVACVVVYLSTREKVMTAGIKTENMDTSVRPGENFYD